jgi:hypothetical protein
MPAMNRNAALQRRGWQPFGGWDFHANALTSPDACAGRNCRDPRRPLEEFAWPRLKAIFLRCPMR